ncbi:MAG TPA: BTAD domain-containing putative transcriptional regulator [Candidatus Dormibacteraeota bacterium]|nr:BTAD domain-containing putative transcriptional regulator [Candidatus Dormibacteraeota bacterium]
MAGRGDLDSRGSVQICLLGGFRLEKAGHSLHLRPGGKAEALLIDLAIRQSQPVARDLLLERLWPRATLVLAGKSLNSLIYSLHKLLGDAIAGAAPILFRDGGYRLNADAGVSVDIQVFEALVDAGDRARELGEPTRSSEYYERALRLYRGDLAASEDTYAVVERERLRSRYLTLLARMADRAFAARDYNGCLKAALQLLQSDPGREDAHRLVMRCHVRLGERAQALRQYRVCEHILRTEFDVAPEPGTVALDEQVRRDPSSV